MNTAPALRMTEPLADEEIVRRVVAGDRPMFEILMRRHNQRIYRAMRAILSVEEEIEDAMQQAWFNAYRHLQQFAGDAQFSTWLTRIAVNEALAHLRKRARFPLAGEEDAVLTLIESNRPDPEEHASSSELREVLEREVAALPEAYRSVVMLRDVEGLSTSETADCLSVSEEVVKTRLHRARTMLRDNLYRRAGVTLQSLYTFGNARCDRIVAAVMTSILAP